MKNYLEKRVSDYMTGQHMLVPGSHITVALSGGLDSMCLLHILSSLAPLENFTVSAAHFNHCIRGAEALRDQTFVQEYCKEHGISLALGQKDVPAFAKEQHLGPEEAARLLRYEFLQNAAPDGGLIATAHTADDNAETVLLHLTRGTGFNGLCGIPPVRDNIIRPLLEITRQELEKYASEHNLPHVEDSSNASDAYTRNVIRHQVMPVLKQINPHFCQSVTRTAQIMGEQNQWILRQADAFLQTYGQDSLPIPALCKLPKTVFAAFFQKIFDGALSGKHMEALEKLCREDTSPSAACSLPGRTVRREYQRLLVEKEPPRRQWAPFSLEAGQTVDCEALHLRFTCTECHDNCKKADAQEKFLFNSSEIYGRIIVRSRKSGDRIHFSGRAHTTNLKKLWIDAHVPAAERDFIPILADEHGILAVRGFGTAARVVPKSGDKIIKIQIEEIVP